MKIGKVLWLTGLSGSGKTTISTATSIRLTSLCIKHVILDGDVLRSGICSDLGFSIGDRFENIRRIAYIARMFADNNFIVIVPVISPISAMRRMARDIVGNDIFREIYIKCNVDICEERDPKGLYKKARSGVIAEFTGVTAEYQAPEFPHMIIDTETTSPDCAASQLVAVSLGAYGAKTKV